MSNKTRTQDDPTLMRLLLGELSPQDARHLERRLADDAELRGRYERLRASWDALEMPPAPPAPGYFRDAVVDAARRLGQADVSWSVAPAWVRPGAAAALVLGLALGLGVGRLSLAPGGEALVVEDRELDADLAAELESGPLSLAEAYWLELEEGGESLLDDSADGETPFGERL